MSSEDNTVDTLDIACESCGRRGRQMVRVVFVHGDSFELCISCAAIAVSNAEVRLEEMAG
jgi:ribosome-binding protein aMBF1 (putative translation factor)